MITYLHSKRIHFIIDLASQFFLFVVCLFVSVIAHNFEISGWHYIRFTSQDEIEVLHSFSHFDLCMTLCFAYIALALAYH